MAIEFLQQISLNQTPVKGFVPEVLTTTERDNLSSVTEGRIIYNSSVDKWQGYVDASWRDLGGTYSISTAAGSVADATSGIVRLTGPTSSDTDDVTIVTADNGGLEISNSTDTITIKHQDAASGLTDLSAGTRTYVTALSFDSFGHVTDYNTATESVTQTRIKADGGSAGFQAGDITLKAGNNIAITEDASDSTILKIASSFTDTVHTLATYQETVGNVVHKGIALSNDENSTVNKVRIIGDSNGIDIARNATDDSITISVGDDVTIGNDLQVDNNANIDANLTVGGDLTVTGTLISTQSERIDLEDSIILLNSNATGTAQNTQDAGLEVERGDDTNVKLLWDESANRWTFTNDGTNFYNLPLSTEYDKYTSWDFVFGGNTTTVTSGTAINFVDGDNTSAKYTAASGGNAATHKIDVANATTSLRGVVELATPAEAKAGTSTTRAVTPKGLSDTIDQHVSNTAFTKTIGDGTNTKYECEHGFGTKDVIVQLYKISTNETVFAETIRSLSNKSTPNDWIEVKFAVAPASNDIRLLVLKVG